MYIAYSKGLILTKEKTTSKGNEQQEEKINEEEAKTPTDMDKVNKELNSYLSKYLKYRFEDNYLNKNMLDDVSNKFALINFILEENEMQKETNYAASGIGRQDFSYIDIDTYKNMYKKIYGSLNDFETEVKNVSPPVFDMANNIDSTMSSDLVAWNSTYGATTQKVTLETKNIVYD